MQFGFRTNDRDISIIRRIYFYSPFSDVFGLDAKIVLHASFCFSIVLRNGDMALATSVFGDSLYLIEIGKVSHNLRRRTILGRFHRKENYSSDHENDSPDSSENFFHNFSVSG